MGSGSTIPAFLLDGHVNNVSDVLYVNSSSVSVSEDHTVRVWPIVVLTDNHDEETGPRHRLEYAASKYTVLHYHKGRAWCMAAAVPTFRAVTCVAMGFDQGVLCLPLDPKQGGIVSAAVGPSFRVSW